MNFADQARNQELLVRVATLEEALKAALERIEVLENKRRPAKDLAA